MFSRTYSRITLLATSVLPLLFAAGCAHETAHTESTKTNMFGQTTHTESTTYKNPDGTTSTESSRTIK